MEKYKKWIADIQSDLKSKYNIKKIDSNYEEGMKITFETDFVYYIDKYMLDQLRKKNSVFVRNFINEDIEKMYMRQIKNVLEDNNVEIHGRLHDKCFVHINKLLYGQVFCKKDQIYMKIRPISICNNLKYEERECCAVNLRNGDIKIIDIKANLRLVECSLELKGYVENKS